MTPPQPQGSRLQARSRRNQRTLLAWTLAWVLATAVLAFGPRFLWNETIAVTIAVLGINLAIGTGLIIANRNHLQTLDELHRKVSLDAMAITLGVVLVTGVPYSLLEAHEVVTFGSGTSGPIAALYILMSVTYMVSIVLGLRRYR